MKYENSRKKKTKKYKRKKENLEIMLIQTQQKRKVIFL